MTLDFLAPGMQRFLGKQTPIKIMIDHGEHVQKTAENTVNMGPSQRDALEEQMTRKRRG